MTHLEWTEPAVGDLEHIRDSVAKDCTHYAGALVERLILTARVREVLVSGYRIIYRVRKDRAQILAGVPSPGNLAGLHPKPWDAHKR